MRPDGDEPDDLERTSLLGDDPHRPAWSAAALLRSMVSRLPRRISRWRPTRVRRVGLVRGGLATLTALVAVVVVLQASGWRWPFARGCMWAAIRCRSRRPRPRRR